MATLRSPLADEKTTGESWAWVFAGYLIAGPF
jgi:hypothetical protein